MFKTFKSSSTWGGKLELNSSGKFTWLEVLIFPVLYKRNEKLLYLTIKNSYTFVGNCVFLKSGVPNDNFRWYGDLLIMLLPQPFLQKLYNLVGLEWGLSTGVLKKTSPVIWSRHFWKSGIKLYRFNLRIVREFSVLPSLLLRRH